MLNEDHIRTSSNSICEEMVNANSNKVLSHCTLTESQSSVSEEVFSQSDHNYIFGKAEPVNLSINLRKPLSQQHSHLNLKFSTLSAKPSLPSPLNISKEPINPIVNVNKPSSFPEKAKEDFSQSFDYTYKKKYSKTKYSDRMSLLQKSIIEFKNFQSDAAKKDTVESYVNILIDQEFKQLSRNARSQCFDEMIDICDKYKGSN